MQGRPNPPHLSIGVAFGAANQKKGVSQMRAPLEARRESAGNQNIATKSAVCF